MRHNIIKKFGDVAKDYDQQRKWLIPCFDEFYACIVDCVGDAGSHTNILDVGAGTGLLSAFLSNVYPKSNYTLIDLSEAMIQQAQNRFSGYKNFTYLIEDYANYPFEMEFDVVVSSLSIHHLEDSEKQLLYKNIFKILRKGGVFVNGDQFLSRSPIAEEHIKRKWKIKIESSILNQTEIDAAYERMKLDKPATVENNITWFENAGFAEVELLYKYYPFGVICGFKPI